MNLRATCKLPLLLALIGLCAVSCSRHKIEPSNGIDQVWAPFLASVSDGEISRRGPIRLRFVESMVDSSEVGKEFQGKLQFEPSIKGPIVWESTHDLVLRPSEELEQGKEYVGRLSPDGLKHLPSDIGEFAFRFSIVRQNFDLELTGFEPIDGPDTTLYAMTGTVKTADKADSTELAGFMQARQQKTSLQVSWTSDETGRKHGFRIPNVHRTAKRSSVTVTLKPKSIGMDKGSEERELPVPALNEFDLLFAKAIDGSTQGIQLQFTDPLSPQTDLGALIRVAGISPLRFDVQGGRVDVFLPKPVAGAVTVEIDERLANRRGALLGRAIRKEITFEIEKPGVRFVGQGVILPDAPRLTVPIEAASVREVTVEALQVYASNMGQFLQVNGWDGDRETRRVGRVLWRKRIKLVSDTEKVPLHWTRYAIDVTDLLKENPGSLFRLQLQVDRSQSVYPCSDSEPVPDSVKNEKRLGNWEDDGQVESSGWDGWAEDWYGEYNYQDRDNPCRETYFTQRSHDGQDRERNMIASNLGLLAKAGTDGQLLVTATNLRTAEVLSGVDFTVYNYQNQPIGEGTSNGDGFATIKPQGVPFYLRAKKGSDIGYLKVSSGAALPVSHFDVGGVQTKEGVKGFLYGERGVWRPGDSIFLTLAIEDKLKSIPVDHPIRFELHDPQGRLVRRETRPFDKSGFHVFRIATDPASPTGTWMASAMLGDKRFEKPVKIEMVKPNRLDVQLKWKFDTLSESDLKGTLKSQWLHGGSAEGLRAEITAVLRPLPIQFTRYADFVFDDPSRAFSSDRQSVFEGTIGPDGKVDVNGSLKISGEPASALQAIFTSHVYESGGDASVERTEAVYHHYARYVGMKIPKGDQAREMLRTDTTHKIQIAVVDQKGQPSSASKLHATLKKINWKWWWEKNEDSPAEFERSEYGTLLKDTVLSASKGTVIWPVRLSYPEWGRYFLRVCDEETGHCTGKVIYMDWPGWAGRAKEQSGVGASMLSVGVDKSSFKVGETAVLTIPSGSAGRALVSLETGSQVLKAFWVETKAGSNRVEIPVEGSMSPIVYAHVSLVQPHEGRRNDLPLRLYGIVPLKVEDPATKLDPKLEAPTEVRPGQALQVSVKETQGRAMNYTVALVDEGLLGLTRFKTPDPLAEFRQKEALGVKTWDLFDWVVGAYGGQLERLLSLGGDESGRPGESSKVNRFPPLVRFYGPFRLEKGKQAQHAFDLPEYIGKVRVMVVAGSDGAWGSTETQVFVRKPLMILPTLPRIVRPGEEIDVPVSVFAMKDHLGTVQVNLNPGGLQGQDGLRRELSFKKMGEAMVKFRLKVPATGGSVTLKFTAQAGSETASQTVQIAIVSAGLPQIQHTEFTVQPGQTWAGKLSPYGVAGSQKAWLEISTLPRLGLESRLQELIGYPHGCLEQTTSKAFPQLLLPDVVQLPQVRKDEIRSNVKIALDKLHGFLQPNGGFGYWPGASEESWATLWAGHFLLEASQRGYEIPGDMLSAWKTRQKVVATKWWSPGDPSSAQEQAYRLFLLALGSSADLSAMNRLRGVSSQLPASASWLLGAAYALSGQADAANSLSRGNPLAVRQYLEPGPTYGSGMRDQAVAIYALAKLGRTTEAQKYSLVLADSLGSDSWHSTQSTAWGLLALANAYSTGQGAWWAKAAMGSKVVDLNGQKSLLTIPVDGLKQDESLPVRLTNRGKAPLYARWIQSGIPEIGKETETSKGLKVEVEFSKKDSSSLEPKSVEQGLDIRCFVTVRNLTTRKLDHLAMSQILPSGWEIRSNRLDGLGLPAGVDYQDVRDDRVLTYFDLPVGGTRRFPLLLHAAYAGKYQLPGIVVESMYEGSIGARTRGTTTTVEP